jgi:hypothetical protein
LPVNLPRLILRLAGVSIAIVTTLAAVTYAAFMVIWMHAPLLHVVAFSTVLCIPTMIIAWGAFRLARKFEKNARHVSSEA